MAENQTNVTQADGPTQAPVLRPGRAADPVPVPAAGAVKEAPASSPAQAPAETGKTDTTTGSDKPSGSAEDSGQTESGNGAKSERVLAESRQRKLRLMLRQCDRVLLMDFDLLAMNGWPDNYAMALARRNRDLWLFSALIAAVVFLSGLTGFVPAWIAGGGFGAFVIILLLGMPAIRRIYTSRPSYLDLVLARQRMLREARQHIARLEGDDGLIWQCAQMAEFNPADSDKLLSLVRGRPYFIRGEHEGQGWLIVHAGVIPGKSVEDSTPFELTRVRELSNMPGNPFWGEVWAGPELVIYGHTVFRFMRTHFVGEKLVSLGLDTGCVYGGTLTAYRIEDGSVVEVAAERSYWPLR